MFRFPAIFALLLLFLAAVQSTDLAAAQSADSSPFAPVHLVEDHSQALSIVARTGKTGLFVLHIGGHDDLWPPPTREQVEATAQLMAAKKFQELEQRGRFYLPRGKSLYGANNFLGMAGRLGIVREVYWTVPTLDPLEEHLLRDILAYLKSRGGPFKRPDDVQLEVQPPFLKGTISGVPVTVGSLRDIPSPTEPVWLDIDLDFFPNLYKNPVSSSYLGLIAALVNRLERAHLRSAVTTIAYSHEDRYSEISERYMGEWLERILKNPEILKQPPPAPWTLKEEARYQEFFQQTDEALNLYREILKQQPDNADAHYSMGMLQLKSGLYLQGKNSISTAAKIDSSYVFGYVSASSLMQKDKPDQAEALLLAAIQSRPNAPLLYEALANFYYNRRDFAAASRYYLKVIEANGASPLTYVYLGDSYFLGGNVVKAVEYYHAAIDVYRSHPVRDIPPATWLQLAKSLEAGKPADSIAVYEEYLALFPDEPETERQSVRQRITTMQSAPTVKP